MPRLSLLPPAPGDSSIRTAARASDEEVMLECPLAVSSALAGMSRLLLSGWIGLGRELRGGPGVPSACALDEVLCSGSGVDLGRVLARSASSAGPGTTTRVLGRTGPPMASASGWTMPGVAAHRLGVRGLIKASGRCGGRRFGEGLERRYPLKRRSLCCPCPELRARHPWQRLGSCGPLCAQCAPDANPARTRTECPLASVEGRWSPLASVMVRQPDEIVT